MRRLEIPASEPLKLISHEKANSLSYKLVKASVILAVIGVAGFFVAFFYQKPITEAGVPYRVVQGISIFVVFAGWALFRLFCAALGINTGKLTYNKLRAILRNQVEVAHDVNAATRKQVGLALLGLSDQWSLYPTVFIADPRKTIPMVLVGPGGVFPIHVIYQDPRKKDFVDPQPILKAASAELEKRLKVPVKPVISFLRNRKYYQSTDEHIKTYTTSELFAHLTSRSDEFDALTLRQIEMTLRELSNIPG